MLWDQGLKKTYLSTSHIACVQKCAYENTHTDKLRSETLGRHLGSLNFSATLLSTLAPAIKCFHGCPSHT